MHYGREFLSIQMWDSEKAQHLRETCARVSLSPPLRRDRAREESIKLTARYADSLDLGNGPRSAQADLGLGFFANSIASRFLLQPRRSPPSSSHLYMHLPTSSISISTRLTRLLFIFSTLSQPSLLFIDGLLPRYDSHDPS